MRSELSEERPPPLGDLIATAMLDGRRVVRRRRYALAGVSAAVVGILVAGAAVAWPSTGPVVQPAAPAASSAKPTAASPETVEPSVLAPYPSSSPGQIEPSAPPLKQWSVPLHGKRATGELVRASPKALLELLTQLLPKGKVTNLAANDDNGLFAQVYLDSGKGPGMLRLWLKPSAGDDIRPGTATFATFQLADDCGRSTVVSASYADGGHLAMDLATCLNSKDKLAPPALTVDEAVKIMSDARWGYLMDADLVAAADKRFAGVPATTE